VIWLFAIFILLGVGAVTAYSLVTNYMSEKDVVMPDVVNLTYEEGLKKLMEAGLDINNIHKSEETSDKPSGVIVKQDQYAGKTIKANREVTLTVSQGVEKISMPKVLGMDKQQATDMIKKMIKDADIAFSEKEDKDATPGTVINQSPYPDVIVEPGTKITLTIAKEIPKAKVPNLENIPLDEAKRQLSALGLKAGEVIESQHATIPKGYVIRAANYAVGTELAKGTEVSLFVSTGPAAEAEDIAPRKKTVEVTVPVKEGAKAVVKIVRNDSRGASDVVSNEEITHDKVYSIECIVEKDQIASIEVWVDGKKQQTVPVPYEQ
jgi:serine/threonine-protein kinase